MQDSPVIVKKSAFDWNFKIPRVLRELAVKEMLPPQGYDESLNDGMHNIFTRELPFSATIKKRFPFFEVFTFIASVTSL